MLYFTYAYIIPFTLRHYSMSPPCNSVGSCEMDGFENVVVSFIYKNLVEKTAKNLKLCQGWFI